MKRNLKLIVLVCVVSALFLCGCEGDAAKSKNAPTRTASPEELRRIEKVTAPVEDTKAQILKQLEGKFEDPEAHYSLGKLYQRDGMWSKAENEFSTALSFDPAHRESQAARVKVLLQSGDRGKAKILANDYVTQAAPLAAGSLRLAMAFQKENLDDYALTCYRQAHSLAPNSAKVNKQMGYFYMTRNQLDLAKDYLIRSFNLDPTQAEVANELGRLGVVVQVRTPNQAEGKKIDKMSDKAKK